jgi:hypothetical protein
LLSTLTMGGNSVIAQLRVGVIAIALALPGALYADPIVSEKILTRDRAPSFEADWFIVLGLQHPALEPLPTETVTRLLAGANAPSDPLLISLDNDSRQLPKEEDPKTAGMMDLRILILAVLLAGGLVRYLTSPHFIAILQDVFGPLHEY